MQLTLGWWRYAMADTAPAIHPAIQAALDRVLRNYQKEVREIDRWVDEQRNDEAKLDECQRALENRASR